KAGIPRHAPAFRPGKLVCGSHSPGAPPMNAAVLVLLSVSAAAPEPARAQAVTQKLYVANSAGNDVHVIDPATNKVIRRVEVGPQPHGLVATRDGRQLFLTTENNDAEEGELLWFDTATDRVTRRMKVGPRPNQLACTPDGKIVYVPCDDA